MNRLQKNGEAIALNLELMAQLDFIFARAGLAMDMNGWNLFFLTRKAVS